MRAGVALGTNLGDRFANFRKARQKIEALDKLSGPFLASAIYETDPVGCEPGAPTFLNAVIEFDYAGEAIDLRRELAAIERALGRPATHERNVSRPIDLDLLYFGELVMETAELRLPHPRIVDREFVLRPLADIRPDLVLPGQTETVGALLGRLPASGVVRLDLEW
ncbi:MAG TPA: 2-amino-4-hydroxy-6-hydroxymethyldihydropteridine diphosphokinase [Chthoniobacterales bacterium]|nr:2-amino-4-hydroxy-6-hydroxymethyldihydropteridine diphosphokinase [Chthoniobacterales bacterium]